MGNACGCGSLSGVSIDIEPPVSLQNIDLTHDHPRFSLEGQTCLGFCTRVIDGDTAVFNIQTNVGIHEYSVRFSHLDAPEMHSKIPLEKHHARACKLLVEQMMQRKFCVLVCGKFEKFGRLLAEMYMPGNITGHHADLYSATQVHVRDAGTGQRALSNLICINTALLRMTPSAPYEGRQKQPFHFDETLVQYHRQYQEAFRTTKEMDAKG